MPIHVVCTGCKAAFQVSEKFAGKKGPCPKCKAIITIPTAAEEIKIHAPEPEGPKDSKGRPVFTPILREETKLSSMQIFAIVAACVTVLIVTLVLRTVPGGPPTILLILGAIGLAPPLGVAGYAFLRDQELQPYRGSELWPRVAASSLVYAALWGVYLWLPGRFGIDGPPYELWSLLFIVPPMFAVGAFTAHVSYDVEFGTGILHYGLYLSVTVILALLAGTTFLLPK
jgi:hypothetical protein